MKCRGERKDEKETREPNESLDKNAKEKQRIKKRRREPDAVLEGRNNENQNALVLQYDRKLWIVVALNCIS